MDASRQFRVVMQEPEQAQAFSEHAFGDVRFEVLRSSLPFEWRVQAVEVGPLLIVPGSFTGKVHLHGMVNTTILCMAEGSAGDGDARDRVTIAGGRAAAVYSNGAYGSWQSEGRCSTPVLRFAAGFVGQQLELMTGAAIVGEPRFSLELATDRGQAAKLERVARFVFAEAEQGASALEHPVIATSLSELLARTLLLAHAHDRMGLLERRPKQVHARVIRQVEDYVRAHAGEPISSGDLARLTSTSAQALEAACMAQRGESLDALIRRARLEHAREALRSDPSLTPTRAAYAAGFIQPERFAAAYFLAFGEHPEQTWRQTRLEHAARPSEPPAARPHEPVGVQPPTTSTPTVFVLGDDPRLVAQLHASLHAAGHAVELFDTVRGFLHADAGTRPGCVVVDLALADHGLLAQEAPTLPRIGIAGADLRTAVAAMKAGALDVLDSPTPAELLVAVEAALARDLVQRQASAIRVQRDARLAALTSREREVVERVARGLLNKQIAAALGISEATVRVHRARGMDKLGVDSVIELVHVLAER